MIHNSCTLHNVDSISLGIAEILGALGRQVA
jgi:hypothetical protein